jgi:hypothetical protein
MIEQLFGSKTRVKLLQLFYSNPNRSFYVREITRKIDEQINSVRRELANLLNTGIIVSDNTNNRLYYEVNQSYEYYDPLLTIFGENGSGGKVTKNKKVTSSVVASNEDKFKSLGHIDLVIYTGQFTRDESSGIDILIVGEVNQNALQKFITELEKQESKTIRYAVMSSTELKYRRQIKDRFIITVLDSKKQVLVDNIGTL